MKTKILLLTILTFATSVFAGSSRPDNYFSEWSAHPTDRFANHPELGDFDVEENEDGFVYGYVTVTVTDDTIYDSFELAGQGLSKTSKKLVLGEVEESIIKQLAKNITALSRAPKLEYLVNSNAIFGFGPNQLDQFFDGKIKLKQGYPVFSTNDDGKDGFVNILKLWVPCPVFEATIYEADTYLTKPNKKAKLL